MKKAILTILILLVLPASASAHTKHLTVRDTVVRWSSPQSFSAEDTIILTVSARGRVLDSVTISDCVLEFSGRGVLVRSDSCGRHLRLRLVNVRSRATRVRVSYHRA